MSIERWVEKSSNRWRLPSTYTPPHAGSQRRDRFPSIEERVAFYMGQWYEPDLQGVPKSSPFSPRWSERYEAIERARGDVAESSSSPISLSGMNDTKPNTNGNSSPLPIWNSDRIATEPIVNPFRMDPTMIYRCSQKESVVDGPPTRETRAIEKACVGTSSRGYPEMIRRALYDTVPAAILHQKHINASWWSRMCTIFWNDGILGLWTELWFAVVQSQHSRPRSADAPAFLWFFGKGVSKASTQWNTHTPVFGRVRDLLAENDARYARNQRVPEQSIQADADGSEGSCQSCGPLHKTILWPLQRQVYESPVSQVPLYDTVFEAKQNKMVWRGSAYPVVDAPILGQLPPELSGFAQR